MVQEELAVEKQKTEKLLQEISQLKCKSESDHWLEWLVGVICEKDKLIDLLNEKCLVLQQTSDESFESCNEQVKVLHHIVETYQEMLFTTETKLGDILKSYELQLSGYEQDFETVLQFLVTLIQKQNHITYAEAKASNPSEQCNKLVERLRETERDKSLFEKTVWVKQKLIDVLTVRLRESDDAVEKKDKLIIEEKAKLHAEIYEKEKEILGLCDVINKFTEKMISAEERLQIKVDQLKEKALNEKKELESNLDSQKELVSELMRIKNEKEIQLQEALDEIETLKCKEEVLEKMREGLLGKCSSLESTVEESRQQLAEWQKMCQERHVDRKLGEFDVQEKIENNTSVIFGTCCSQKNNVDSVDELSQSHVLAKKLVEFMSEKNLVRQDTVNRLRSVEDTNEYVTLLEEVLLNTFTNNCDEDKAAFLQHLLTFIFSTVCKLKAENINLMNNFTRLQNDFIEKCDACAELTHLLHMSEKNIAISEKTTYELESCREDWKMKYIEQENQIKELQFEKLALEKELACEKARAEERESKLVTLNEELVRIRMNSRLTILENSLKE